MPTISEIENAVITKSPYFFSDSTLEFFEQTKSDFKVKVSPTGKTFIYAPCRYNGKLIGYTFREFTGDDLAIPVHPIPDPSNKYWISSKVNRGKCSLS